MGMSIAPGFCTEKRHLARLLDQAADLSRRLDVTIDGRAVEEDLRSVNERLRAMIAYRSEKQ